jgi:hypothetical protein
MFCPARLFHAADTMALELPHLETFSGAACYQPIELPSYKAAPLQAFGPLNTQRVCKPSVFFFILQALWRFLVTRPRILASRVLECPNTVVLRPVGIASRGRMALLLTSVRSSLLALAPACNAL